MDSTLVGGVVQDGEADLAELLGFDDVVRLQSLGRRPGLTADLMALREIRKAILDVRPHVVHTHMAKAGALGRMAAFTSGVKVRVHTFHGHTLYGYWNAAVRKGVIVAERALSQMSTALVAVSERIRQDLLAQGIGRPDRFFVLNAGLNLSPFLVMNRGRSEMRSRLRIPPDAKVIAFVGRLVPIKGVDLFLQAVEPLLTELPQLHIIIAGDGPEAVRVRKTVLAHPRGEHIHMPGWISDVADVYGAADVVALSSRNEGTPLSLIEASAAAVPVVATAVGGVPDFVTNESTGLLVRPGDYRSLSAALRRLLNDSELGQRLAAAGRDRARQYTAEQLARDLSALYRRLLEDSSRRSRAGGRSSTGPR